MVNEVVARDELAESLREKEIFDSHLHGGNKRQTRQFYLLSDY